MTPPRRNPSPPQHDPLLDSLLEEVLGGTTPPDLRDRILRRNAPPKSENATEVPGQPVPTTVLAPPVHDWSQGSFGSPASIADRRGRRRTMRRWTTRILTTALLTAGALLLLVAWQSTDRWKAERLDESALARGTEVVESDVQSSPSRELTPRTQIDQIASREQTQAPSLEPRVAAERLDEVPTEPFGQSIPTHEEEPFETDLPEASVVERIDEYLQRAWDVAQVQPAPLISDQQWCQRVYVHLLGRSPSDEELASFLQLDPSLRRQQLVDRLLTDRRYREEYAQHWASQWSEKLIGSALDDAPSTASLRAGLERYLRPALLRNTTCDQIAGQLLTATGSNSVNEQDYNPATNYLLALMDGRGIRTTEEVCRVMLGQRAACAQCHDDPHNNLDQEQFWQLTACFRQLHVQSLGAGRLRLSDRDFGGDRADGKQIPGTVAYQRADGTWRHVPAVLPDGGPLSPSGRVDDAHYRLELAQWLVSTKQFSRAMVNRFWAEFFQYGFTFPVDDMGRHNPVAHPELLDLLADEFASSGCDLNQLLRWIVLSDAFSRSDVLTEANTQDMPLAGAPPLFSHVYYRPSSFVDPVQAIAQLIQGRIDASARGTAERLDDAIVAQVRPTLTPDAEAAPAGPDGQPSAQIGQQLTIGQLRLVRAIAASQLSVEQRIEHVFRIAFGRAPRPDEARRAREICEAEESEPLQSLESLLWALVNTNEFVRNH